MSKDHDLNNMFREILCDNCYEPYRGIFVAYTKINEKVNVCPQCKRNGKTDHKMRTQLYKLYGRNK